MERYQVSFGLANDSKKNLPASGDLFVYESAVAATDAETRIRVKPDSGAVIVLRPGQWFRNPNKVTGWALESFSGADVITANVVIGYGEFGDANTLNKVTLDATFANVVKVSNTPAERVPVTMDTTQLLKLDPSYAVSTTAPVMAYTNSKTNQTVAASSPLAIVTPAENVNGVILEQHIVGAACSVLAKSSLPANGFDGDLLAQVNSAGTYIQRIKVAAGKGIYWFNSNGASLQASALYTIL